MQKQEREIESHLWRGFYTKCEEIFDIVNET